jgi:hypothetical protein
MNYIKYNHLNPSTYNDFVSGQVIAVKSNTDSTALYLLATGVVILILINIYIESEKSACQITNNRVT